MKIKVSAGGKGWVTFAETNTGYPHKFQFTYQDLVDWYPLDSSYDYVYDPDIEDCFVVRQLGLTSTNRHKQSFVELGDILDLSTMDCPTMQNNNSYICDFANELGLKSLRDSYSWWDVRKGFDKVSTMLDQLTQREAKKCMNDTHSPNQRFQSYNSIRQEGYALKRVSEDVQYQYILLGNLYTMYNVMRKVVDHIEFTGVSRRPAR